MPPGSTWTDRRRRDHHRCWSRRFARSEEVLGIPFGDRFGPGQRSSSITGRRCSSPRHRATVEPWGVVTARGWYLEATTGTVTGHLIFRLSRDRRGESCQLVGVARPNGLSRSTGDRRGVDRRRRRCAQRRWPGVGGHGDGTAPRAGDRRRTVGAAAMTGRTRRLGRRTARRSPATVLMRWCCKRDSLWADVVAPACAGGVGDDPSPPA